MALANVALAGEAVNVPIGPACFDRVTVSLDNSYPQATGGYAASTLIKSALGQSSSRTIVGILQASAAGGYRLYWNRTTGKITVWYQDCDAVADGPLVEVSNGANLAAITGVELLVISK